MLEKEVFKSGSIRKKELGNVKGLKEGNDFDFKSIKHNCILRKDNLTKEYVLYVPKKFKKEEYVDRKEYISLDPGIRTFLTGVTKTEVIEIGKNIAGKIKTYIKKINGINKNKEISKERKKKVERICVKKIQNHVNELHWKTITYLTKTYDNILIGNMSTKNIVSNDKKLPKIIKRIAMYLRFYEFRERLKYKCTQRNNKYKLVNESYTSKMCSNCGHIKEDLGCSKIYKCNKCGIEIGRDVNGGRGILLKGML
jgi:putative transposase